MLCVCGITRGGQHVLPKRSSTGTAHPQGQCGPTQSSQKSSEVGTAMSCSVSKGRYLTKITTLPGGKTFYQTWAFGLLFYPGPWLSWRDGDGPTEEGGLHLLPVVYHQGTTSLQEAPCPILSPCAQGTASPDLRTQSLQSPSPWPGTGSLRRPQAIQ